MIVVKHEAVIEIYFENVTNTDGWDSEAQLY